MLSIALIGGPAELRIRSWARLERDGAKAAADIASRASATRRAVANMVAQPDDDDFFDLASLLANSG